MKTLVPAEAIQSAAQLFMSRCIILGAICVMPLIGITACSHSTSVANQKCSAGTGKLHGRGDACVVYQHTGRYPGVTSDFPFPAGAKRLTARWKYSCREDTPHPDLQVMLTEYGQHLATLREVTIVKTHDVGRQQGTRVVTLDGARSATVFILAGTPFTYSDACEWHLSLIASV